MECMENIQQICEALGEDIDSPLCQEIQEHLDQCQTCCAEVDSIKKVVHLYQRLGDADVPESVDQRLWKVLNLQKPAA